jgi:hypothetical protein
MLNMLYGWPNPTWSKPGWVWRLVELLQNVYNLKPENNFCGLLRIIQGFDMAGYVKRNDLEKKDSESKEFLDDQLEGERKWRMEGKDNKATEEAMKKDKRKEQNRLFIEN